MPKRLILFLLLASAPPFLTYFPGSIASATNKILVDTKQNSQSSNSTLDNLISGIEQKFFNHELSKAELAELIALVEKYPQNSRAHILLGNCCDAMGLPLQAMEQYKLAFKYGPTQVDSFVELIKAMVRSGQLTAATSLLKQAMERFPAHPQILFWTGNALYKEKRYDEAAALYQEAVAKSKKPIVGLYSALANLHMQQEHYAKAFDLASLDLSYDKNLPQANEVLGSVLYRLGKLEKACPYLIVAFRNDPNNSTLAFELAQSLVWSGKYNEAFLPSLIAFVNAPSYQNKASAQKTIDEIIPHLSKRLIKENISAIGRFPGFAKNAELHLQLAKICLDKNLVDLALTEYLLSSKLDPYSAITKYRLAIIMESYRHQYPLALQYLREALVLEPYNPQIKQHLMRLEDRFTINKSDWAWRLKDWLTAKSRPAV